MNDLISRQAAIGAIRMLYPGIPFIPWNRQEWMEQYKQYMEAERALEQLPAATRSTDEWCVDCSEYDSEKHCCPRFNRVIRDALGNTPNTLEALEALERILNFCEEIDLHLPEAERSGYRMLPDYEVVRKALAERKHGKWIDLHPQGDSRFMCSVCKWKEHVPTCMGKPTVWEYCPSCGSRMDGDGNG